ncbi:hypothetical protein [Aeromonas rivipollensis]|uniref:hypothetical protein n=1 Tax=Aeromonas rivipollensis TaxID=948519 RepID=UPI00259E90EE|nr:hypothetical protein [Aeromonas rivipollensis]MDM5093092.1 hypothetical protein [Aeromonas rivipollensis]
MKKQFLKIWSDPVWSKVIATAIIAVFTGVITNYKYVKSVLFELMPSWAGYILLSALAFLALFYLYEWLKKAMNERNPKRIYIREDMLAKNMGYSQIFCSCVFEYNKNMTLGELIRHIAETYIEYSLHELEYGKDWVLLSLTDKVMFDKHQEFKTLSQLGIKPGDYIEVYPYANKEKILSFPTHPSLCVHPNHYRGE